ncbi:MAG: methenyltetrahydromethanopterin cyclohydrolase [Gemmatimonadales bacterium]
MTAPRRTGTVAATPVLGREGQSTAPARAVCPALALNEHACAMADDLIARAAEFRVASSILANGARVIDAGLAVRGGYAAGRALARICMGGLGHVQLQTVAIGGTMFPGVEVWTDHPAISCMASQYAGWAIKTGSFFGMGSGPLRAHARVETELFAKLKYVEATTHGVLVLETRTHPTEDVAAWVAERAHLTPAQLTFLVAPTASIAGCVQIVARILETGLHKMDTLGFDITRVVSGIGTAPIPPAPDGDLHGIGRTNDCILYGGQARYTVDAGDDELSALAPKVPAEASRDYGTPFYDTFKRYNNDFYKIDPLLFSPAEVWLTSASSGRTFHAGHLNLDVLAKSLYS